MAAHTKRKSAQAQINTVREQYLGSTIACYIPATVLITIGSFLVLLQAADGTGGAYFYFLVILASAPLYLPISTNRDLILLTSHNTALVEHLDLGQRRTADRMLRCTIRQLRGWLKMHVVILAWSVMFLFILSRLEPTSTFVLASIPFIGLVFCSTIALDFGARYLRALQLALI